jgi:RNA polymerase sigma-70 factor (ECF subfamily)
MARRQFESRTAREQEFEALFRANVARVRSYVARRVAEGREDAVAETFTVAWRRLEEVPESALPWLLGVARRVLANQRRSASRQAALGERLSSEPVAVVEAVADPRSDAVLAALGALRERDREVLLLVERDGVTRDEAARVLGVTRPELRLRLHRARRRFIALYDARSTPTTEGALDVRS